MITITMIGDDEFVVASNALLVLTVGLLVWLGLDARYHFQINMLLGSVVASVYHHLCRDLAWCTTGALDDGAAEFQAMCVVSILIDQWWLTRAVSSPRIFAWFCVASSVGTTVLSTHFAAGLQTTIAVPTFWAACFFYALVYNRMHYASAAWSWWRWTRLLLALGAFGGGVGCRVTAQHDALLHGVSHVLFGVGAFLAVSLVDAPEPIVAPDKTASVALLGRGSGKVHASNSKRG